MRLAVFTNQFPGAVSTFFARDMRGLIEAEIEIDVFPVRPLDERLWKYVPAILDQRILPRENVHHLTFGKSLRYVNFSLSRQLTGFFADSLAAGRSAASFGLEAFAKTTCAVLKGWIWAQQYPRRYDHVLAYWGNYAGTCAYIYHRLCAPDIPFSIFLHANADLYRNAVFMKTKLLYADNILTCSNFNRNFILNHFSNVGADLGEKIRVHQHGLNFADLPFRLSQRVPSTIIAVGRFVKQKGFDVLLHAMQILRTRGISVQLQLVGDGTEARFLRSLVSQLNISDAVNFSGWLPADEVPNAIAKAALLVHPSPDIGDGVPNVIKEAMAVGTPVVATRVAGIPELLDNGKCGMIIPPRDAKALAQAIERVLTNGSLGCEYAIKARQRAEAKFDLWRNGVRLAKILRSLRQFDEDCIEALPGDRPQ